MWCFRKGGKSVWAFRIALAFFLLIFSGLQSSAHYPALHHAEDKKDITNYGSYAVIQGTNPDLHGGNWTYVRVASVRNDPWRYAEMGWFKDSAGFKGLIVWDDGARHERDFTYSSGTDHSFMNWYEPTYGKWNWYYDGNWIYGASLGVSATDFVLCGGEVATGVEGMGNTRCGNGGSNGLQYMPSIGGQWQYWNGHVSYIEDPPYETVYIDDNNFRATGNE